MVRLHIKCAKAQDCKMPRFLTQSKYGNNQAHIKRGNISTHGCRVPLNLTVIEPHWWILINTNV